MRTGLLIFGFILFLCRDYLRAVPMEWHFIFFITGIVLLGIPHGAADLLVGTQNAKGRSRSFSVFRFLAIYISRLLVFGCLIYFFPVAGILCFLLFSAYHFGETDLFFLETNTLVGKIVVASYGLVILCVMLLGNAADLKQFLETSGYAMDMLPVIDRIEQNRYIILSVALVFFFCCIFLYFTSQKSTAPVTDTFLLHFGLLVFILYHLPLLTGFTFYFVVWHSVLSLKNIISYLRKSGNYSYKLIMKQISFFTLLALAGISISGVAGYMYSNNEAVMLYFILGLAVLTVPHMQVMHSMYSQIRGTGIKEEAIPDKMV